MDPRQPSQIPIKTPDCDFQARLGAFYDGELDAAAERLVERHLASCETCRFELQEMRELSTLADRIGGDAMSATAVRRIHRAIDAERQPYSILRIAGALTGLAASVMVIGAAWLWEGPDSGSLTSHKHVIVFEPGPSQKWEYLAVNLRPDPLPTTRWEVDDQQILASARLTNWMLEGLGGSGR